MRMKEKKMPEGLWAQRGLAACQGLGNGSPGAHVNLSIWDKQLLGWIGGILFCSMIQSTELLFGTASRKWPFLCSTWPYKVSHNCSQSTSLGASVAAVPWAKTVRAAWYKPTIMFHLNEVVFNSHSPKRCSIMCFTSQLKAIVSVRKVHLKAGESALYFGYYFWRTSHQCQKLRYSCPQVPEEQIGPHESSA